jgi:opacity protein-like surface antigen
MKRFFCLLVLAMAAMAIASQANAGQRVATSRYGEWVRVNHNGVITYRYVYRGFKSGFPPPAMYYYGYPQSGYTYGTGI